ncbi:hypothetical protein SprV_0200804200 [Sparganum proliferum]
MQLHLRLPHPSLSPSAPPPPPPPTKMRPLFYHIVRWEGPRPSYKNSLKRPNPETRVDLTQNRPIWRREVKTGAAIYDTNRTAATKARQETRKSKVPRLLYANHPPIPTCPRCQRAFRARIGHAGHLRKQCTNNPATSASPFKNTPSITPAANPTTTTTPVTGDQTPDAPPPSISDIIHPVQNLPSITATSSVNTTTSRTAPID